MTKLEPLAKPIDQLEPGRELNEAVAEHVFEWERLSGDAIPEKHRHLWEEGEQVVWLDDDGRRMACSLCGTMPDFSGEYSGITDAWRVIEHLRAGGWWFSLSANDYVTEPWDCRLILMEGERTEKRAIAHGPTPAIAICRAALATRRSAA